MTARAGRENSQARPYIYTRTSLANVFIYNLTLAKNCFTAQPHLIAKSPSQVFALPGDEISFSVETERGLKTTWIYDAQVIPEIPDDPDMAFQRTLKKDKISEVLVISSVDWRHFGIYVVETEKGGCKGAVTFHLQQDQGERLLIVKFV